MSIMLSKIDGAPVAFVYENALIRDTRTGPDDPEQILQSSGKRLRAGQEFRAHSHLATERSTVGTQEAWVVVSGIVEVVVYDIDDTVLDTITLTDGDCLVTFRGGHSMTVLRNTLLYEFKNGPYFGSAVDKRWL